MDNGIDTYVSYIIYDTCFLYNFFSKEAADGESRDTQNVEVFIIV